MQNEPLLAAVQDAPRKTGPKPSRKAWNALYLPGKLYALLDDSQNTSFIEWVDDDIFRVNDMERVLAELGGRLSENSLKEDLRKHDFFQVHHGGSSQHRGRTQWKHRQGLFRRGHRQEAESIRRRPRKRALPQDSPVAAAMKFVCSATDLSCLRTELLRKIQEFRMQLAAMEALLDAVQNALSKQL